MKKLGSLEVCGIISDVVVATSEEARGEVPDSVEGMYDPGATRLWLIVGGGYGRSFTRMRDTLAHEALHKLFACTAAGQILRNAVGSDEAAYELEETIVRAMGPGLVSLAPGLISVFGRLAAYVTTRKPVTVVTSFIGRNRGRK